MENLTSIILIIVIVVVLKILSTLVSPNFKGKIGESIVSRKLEKLQPDNYKIINNIMIINQHGSSQIDHVVICPFGIIVIETKYYKGWIFGSENSTHWTQVIYHRKFKLFNPIVQNKGHINALKYNLPSQYFHIPYYPVVVLAGSCQFKSFDKVSTPVIYPGDIYKTVIGFSGKQVLNQKDMENINDVLNKISHADKESINEHIQNIRNKKKEFYTNIEMGKCPRCGGLLVERSGKYGEFLGCKNYPKCNFTKGL